MKKFLVTILAVFYLGVSSGATVHFHHCMGQLVEWGFSSTKHDGSDSCSKCGMGTGSENDCCKHQSKEAKVDKVQKASESSYQFKVLASELKHGFAHFHIIPYARLSKVYPLLNSPPGQESSCKYLQICSFRI